MLCSNQGETNMPAVHYACPNCRHSFDVPPEIIGGQGVCPKCRALLKIKQMSGKTILELAEVDGHAKTTLQPNIAGIAPTLRIANAHHWFALAQVLIWSGCLAILLLLFFGFLSSTSRFETDVSSPHEILKWSSLSSVLWTLGFALFVSLFAQAASALLNAWVRWHSGEKDGGYGPNSAEKSLN